MVWSACKGVSEASQWQLSGRMERRLELWNSEGGRNRLGRAATGGERRKQKRQYCLSPTWTQAFPVRRTLTQEWEGNKHSLNGSQFSYVSLNSYKHPWIPELSFSRCNRWSSAVIALNFETMTDRKTCCRMRGKKNGKEMPRCGGPEAYYSLSLT